jgi:glycine dehydrogenase subunit 1
LGVLFAFCKFAIRYEMEFLMNYIPNTEADRQAMLKTIGVETVADLFEAVPERVRFPRLSLPKPISEMEIMAELTMLSDKNADAHHYAGFIGAGAYNHFIPSVVGQLQMRSEFYTAYTPYQPEVSQGTLQAMFEYQTMVAELTGMEVVNASHYDGATSMAEAALMAYNIARGRRTKIVVSPAVNPHYRDVMRTYFQGIDLVVTGDEDPQTDIETLKGMLDKDTACLIVQTPNFFGELEPVNGLAEAVHAAGALLIVHVDPHSLGLFAPPGHYGADIVTAEGQAMGNALNFGGPYLGIFAAQQKYVRKMPGRLVGQTTDTHGKRGFVLTLSTREQHIRREKATSNICTNTGLVALGAAIYLATMGKKGLRRVAELCYHKAHYAAGQIEQLAGYSLVTSKPFFKEFVIQCPKPVSEINRSLLEHKIIGGYDLSERYPDRQNQMLIAVTEMNTRPQIDKFVSALKEVA